MAESAAKWLTDLANKLKRTGPIYLSSFPSRILNHHGLSTINMIFICSTTWNSATYLLITRANRLAHRVSSIHQNQTKAFSWWYNQEMFLFLAASYQY
jgi:hypothetical protein